MSPDRCQLCRATGHHRGPPVRGYLGKLMTSASADLVPAWCLRGGGSASSREATPLGRRRRGGSRCPASAWPTRGPACAGRPSRWPRQRRPGWLRCGGGRGLRPRALRPLPTAGPRYARSKISALYCSPTSGNGCWAAASARSNACSRVKKRFSAFGRGSFIPAAGLRAMRPSRTAPSETRNPRKRAGVSLLSPAPTLLAAASLTGWQRRTGHADSDVARLSRRVLRRS